MNAPVRGTPGTLRCLDETGVSQSRGNNGSSALLPPKAGDTITVRYIGLAPVPTEVTVAFE